MWLILPFYRYRWHIPITYRTDTENNTKLVWFDNDLERKIKSKIIRPKNATLLFSNLSFAVLVHVTAAHKWIKFNNDQIGYYRVNYHTDMWAELTKVLNDETDVCYHIEN